MSGGWGKPAFLLPGEEIYFSPGSEKNLKVTTIDDIEIFKALLHTSQDEWIKRW